MKTRVKTTILQEMVSKAVKGASCNRMIPITGLIEIKVNDGVLSLTTTDAINTLILSKKDIPGDDFYAVVPIDIFSKLVAKTTAEYISLAVDGGILEITGNGSYRMELPLDEEGEPIVFPSITFDTKVPATYINATSIKRILETNKASLAETMEVPCLTGYCCLPDMIISTDSFKVCGNAIKVFAEPVLISTELMDLLSLIDSEKISVQQSDDELLFEAEGITIYGVELEGMSEYPVDAIKAYLETDFPSKCKLPKSALLNVIDRLSLFVTSYDKNALYATFTPDGLVINSKQKNGSELIKYQGSENFQPFTCCIDLELMKAQVNAISEEVVELWYGHEKAIKMTSPNVTQILALLEDDRAEEM